MPQHLIDFRDPASLPPEGPGLPLPQAKIDSGRRMRPRFPRSVRPEIAQLFRRGSLGVFEFPSRQARREQRKNGARNLLGVDAGVATHAILDALDECASPSRRYSRRWMPAVVVKPTQQIRQLSANIHSLFLRQDITKRMQGRKEGGIDPIAIMPPEALLKIVDPFLGGADGSLEFYKVPHTITSAGLWNRALRQRRTFHRQRRFLEHARHRLLTSEIPPSCESTLNSWA